MLVNTRYYTDINKYILCIRWNSFSHFAASQLCSFWAEQSAVSVPIYRHISLELRSVCTYSLYNTCIISLKWTRIVSKRQIRRSPYPAMVLLDDHINPKVIIEAVDSHKGQCFQQWFGTVLSGRYPRTAAELKAANQWYDKIMKPEVTDAIVIPGNYRKRDGCYVMVTTDESKKVYQENLTQFVRTGQITNPDWLHRGVYWFDSLAPGNIKGMTDWWHEGRWIGPAIKVIDWAFWQKGQPHWRLTYCQIKANYTGPYLEQGPPSYQDYLRNIIWAAFDASFIIEYRISLTRNWFRCISIGMRCTAPGRKCMQQAMYLVGGQYSPWLRDDKTTEDWWKYNNWVSHGQSRVAHEWGLTRA